MSLVAPCGPYRLWCLPLGWCIQGCVFFQGNCLCLSGSPLLLTEHRNCTFCLRSLGKSSVKYSFAHPHFPFLSFPAKKLPAWEIVPDRPEPSSPLTLRAVRPTPGCVKMESAHGVGYSTQAASPLKSFIWKAQFAEEFSDQLPLKQFIGSQSWEGLRTIFEVGLNTEKDFKKKKTEIFWRCLSLLITCLFLQGNCFI